MLKNNPDPTLLSSYHFDVPEELVAQSPKDKRDNSKLLERKKTGALNPSNYSDLSEIIPENSLVILNQTKVFSCRILTKTATGGKLEIFLLENPLSKNSSTLKALVRPAKKIKEGMSIDFEDEVQANVVKIETSGSTKLTSLTFNLEPKKLNEWVDKVGSIPLPPYIRRSDKSQHQEDKERYQTVYAKELGSVAAPTAGLHFTDDLLEKLKKKNIEVATITLHVGLGTFLPVKEENITNHIMHEETYRVPKETVQKIEKKKANNQKVILVGTTSLRCLESFYLKAKQEEIEPVQISDKWLSTSLFVHPQENSTLYTPQIGDALLTNFHQPGSSLFILICALIGREEALELYEEAIQKKYRFFSYGDSSLLWLS